MKMKRLVLITTILMVAILSLSMVNADLFGSSDEKQDVGGISFNIPGDFKQVDKSDLDLGTKFKGFDSETKFFEFNVSDGTFQHINDIAISVISGDDLSLDDVDSFKEEAHGLGESSDDIKFNKTTIEGKSGLYYSSSIKYESTNNVANHYIFYYPEGDDLVKVELVGSSPYIESYQVGDIIKE